MSSLQVPSLQVINYVPSYTIQISIKTLIIICLTIIILSFTFCLIIVHKFSQRNKQILKKENASKELLKENMKECRNNSVEEEFTNIKLIINLLKNEFNDKINQIENKNNAKQDENLNLLKENLRKMNLKVEQYQQINQEKNNLLENISNKVDKLHQNVQYNKNQYGRFNAFLDNYSIDTYDHYRNAYSTIRLNGSTYIPLQSRIGTRIIRVLHSIGSRVNFKYYEDWNKIKISQHLNEITSRNLFIVISIINDEKSIVISNPHLHEIPLYMLCLLFGTKISTFDGEDITDLFENNFNIVKNYYYNRYNNLAIGAGAIDESKKMLDMCNIENLRDIFK